jgi:hypothetical protein
MRTLPLFLLALGLAACGDPDDSDIKTDDTGPGTNPTADEDGDGYSVEDGDCDDDDPDVHPSAEEIPCDGLDNDCADGDLTDQDGDGYDCPAQGGDDCDDTDPAFHPGAEDECGDFVDHDCDEDPECDCDGDGVDGEQCDGDDCDDANADAYPGNDEVWYDDVDNDCDGGSDFDQDGDGFDSAEHDGNDCDDTDAGTHPGAEDICYDGVDNDCGDFDDYDCDQDGYLSVDYGGDDCDDGDDTINPGAAEICGDGVDQDCNEVIDDADVDGDGYVDADCGGDDCDDSDATVNPTGDESSPDGLDSDCDGDVDEDGYINLYAPFANGSSALWTYDTERDGTVYVEEVAITSWDGALGEATLERTLTDTTGVATIVDEYWTCDSDAVAMTGLAYLLHGTPALTAGYSEPRIMLLEESLMVPGETWDYSYDAMDATMGGVWTAEGTITIIGYDTITVTAGTFDALVIENDYKVTDTGGMGKMGFGLIDRDVVATMYYVERLGMVYTEEEEYGGAIVETRELNTYTGFYP